MARISLAAGFVLSSGCGSTPNEAASPAPPERTSNTATTTAPQERLQGTWEIVRYESKDPIPNEAMPLMGELFENLRLEVKGDVALVDGKASKFHAEAPDSAARTTAPTEDRASFRLATEGMFNNTSCRFLSEDEWQVEDPGPSWAGRTVLRRVR